MSDKVRARAERQIWITRTHLGALGMATFFIAMLAFMVGRQVGLAKVPEPESPAGPAPLLPDPDREDALEALLREVEYARAAERGPNQLSFPEELAGQADGVAFADVPPPTQATHVSAPSDPPLAPPRPAASNAHRAPTGGWAVQIASYPTSAEADVRIAELAEAGLKPYRVAALVDGATWYRVRVGGYSTQSRANSARTELGQRLGAPDLLVAEAP